ncbi:flagellar biosynthetic protein FliR [Nitrospira defluvii]|nr:flagellar biosynthetic protein FliR [Nitrospira defluvii]
MAIVEAILRNEGAFLFILARVAAFLFAIPLIGGIGVPGQIKALIVVSMAFVLFQMVQVETQPLNIGTLTVGLIGEVLIGFVISLGVRLVFGAVDIGASVVGMQMGFGAARLFDPITSQQSSLIGRFQGIVAMLIFLSVNGHYIIIKTMVQSFEFVPFFGFYPSKEMVGYMMQLAGKMFLLGVKIGIPVMVSLLMANVAIGILGRVVPQLNVLLFSFPITIMLGLVMFGLSLPVFVQLFRREVMGLNEVLPHFLMGMRR